eukprot:TRINITY_DN11305_c0_g1::TRINITY_DN11305_c0_g1_i1::g.769::m.769 TRINITY_DN11305_c0_g1::TRINITY_DN11305_c0_g1_i1::g.769  ORF type:complete len:423 (+),score=135.15,sp/Q54C70/ODPA_DICDI/59.39/5e-153,E1_dh/PF00676.15/2.1e-115,DXP_synthase_N/PF13292.1/3.1e-05,DXP_synthase_N/PF13292.1/1.2e+03,Transketolase_N/PF00456.16/0.028 TRINITY_DN11305_c0_g1_i1:54-1271(+)
MATVSRFGSIIRAARGVVSQNAMKSTPVQAASAISIRNYHKDSQKPNGIKIKFTKPIDTYLCDGPKDYGVTDGEELLGFLREMMVMRRMEIVADQLYKSREIRGFCHLYDGQEAIASGIEAALTKQDYYITAYRDHCNQLLRGDTVESVLAELLGRVTGCSKGKGGSMHMYFPKAHFYGGNGIVGAQAPLGTGLAFAAQYRGEPNVAITMYGDGAANQGQIYEAMNMAALWKLPTIFICENNKYGMGTATNRSAADDRYYTRGHYIPGLRVDGMDVLAVREAMWYAADHCRSGKGPFMMEFDTYRYHGHSMSDPGISYRTRDEVAAMRAERDPIERVRKWILENNIKEEKDLKQLERDVRKEIDEASQKALAAPELDISELYKDVYSENNISIRGVEVGTGFNPQ